MQSDQSFITSMQSDQSSIASMQDQSSIAACEEACEGALSAPTPLERARDHAPPNAHMPTHPTKGLVLCTRACPLWVHMPNPARQSRCALVQVCLQACCHAGVCSVRLVLAGADLACAQCRHVPTKHIPI